MPRCHAGVLPTLEKMPGHTRLYRRGATYYHRAVVPKDIIATYGKREETFSLGTKDHAEAARKVRLAAVEVDRRFDEHRRRLKHAEEPALAELTPQQIAPLPIGRGRAGPPRRLL